MMWRGGMGVCIALVRRTTAVNQKPSASGTHAAPKTSTQLTGVGSLSIKSN